MRKFVNKYIALLTSDLKASLEYPGKIIIWMFDAFFIPAVLLMVWKTIIITTPSLLAQEQNIINYYVIMPLFSLITSNWHSVFFANYIRNGELSARLLKPFSPLVYSQTNNIAEKIVKLFFLLPFVILGGSFFSFQITLTIRIVIAVILSLIFGVCMHFLMENIIGFIGFWTDDVTAFKFITEAVYQVLGGRVVPLFLFPPLLRIIASWTPYRYISAFSLEILTGSLTPIEIWYGFGWQIGWLLILAGLSRLLWIKGIKNYSGVGG